MANRSAKSLGSSAAIGAVSTASVPTGNLSACVEEVRVAALDEDPGPPDPTRYGDLLRRLDASRGKMPPVYRQALVDPFKHSLEQLGEHGFVEILLRDPERQREGGLVMDMAHAVLQNGEGYQAVATDAFQEVISDLYDGFLSAEDRRGVKHPDHEVIAPLVKWGNPSSGPYTWPVDATSSLGAQCAVVNLPPTNAAKGLLAWTALAHETAGHDIIHADTGLEAELQGKVRAAVLGAQPKLPAGLAEYWAARIDETASDVLGILNMGPVVGLGLIGYFRGLNAAFTGQPVLRNDGPASDPHPADVLRGFLAAATVKLLGFDGAAGWAAAIERETCKDAGQKLRLAGRTVSLNDASASAEVVAKTLVKSPLTRLENHRLIDIQDWRNHDQRIAVQLIPSLTRVRPVAPQLRAGIYAAHVVAAAATAALTSGGAIGIIFSRMRQILKQMHDSNAAWGPLYVRHAGNIYCPHAYDFEVAAGADAEV